MKFDRLAAAYLRVLTESHDEYLPGQSIGDNYIILGREGDSYNVAEIGEQDVYPASELKDTGTTIGGMQVMTWSHTGEDIIVSNDKTEEGDYVGFPIEGGFLMTAEEIADL